MKYAYIFQHILLRCYFQEEKKSLFAQEKE